MSVCFTRVDVVNRAQTHTFSMSDALYEYLIESEGMPMKENGGMAPVVEVPIDKVRVLLYLAGEIGEGEINAYTSYSDSLSPLEAKKHSGDIFNSILSGYSFMLIKVLVGYRRGDEDLKMLKEDYLHALGNNSSVIYYAL